MENDSDTDVDDILTDLLSNNVEENQESVFEKPSEKSEFNFLDQESIVSYENKPVKNQSVSEVYDDKLDSSDDEDRRYFEEQKYSDYGRDIKHLLKNQPSEKPECSLSSLNKKNSKSFDFNNITKNVDNSTFANTASKDVYSDPFFGIRIISPLISSAELKERMTNKVAVTVSKIKSHIASGNLDNDWVIAGVLVNASATKISQKGSSYCIWKLTDLSDNMNTVSLFLFSNAYKTFWKTSNGSVIGVLNPKILESNDNTDQATLSVDNPQKIMILGKSKDMGKCKSTKKNGEPCTAIVNINRCEYCTYHVKQEYKKCSRRADILSSNSAGFSSDVLKRKTQQTKRLFNQNIQTFTPIPARRNEKLYTKDCERLALLSGSANYVQKPKTQEQNAEPKKKGVAVELTSNQMKKDFERLNKLRGWKSPAQVTLKTPLNNKISPQLSTSSNSSPSIESNIANNDTEKKGLSNLFSLSSSPRLGAGCKGEKIDLTESITKKHINAAKMNAIKWIQKNGKIKAQDPNKVRLSKEEKSERGIKRQRETEDEEREVKKINALNKFKEMMEAQSTHTDLIEKSYEEEKEKYFNKMEMKERMEEKMLTTYKVDCKAVKCLVCKYTSFSASDFCKEKKHPLKVMDAVKRFFKCLDCGNRTVSLDRLPSHSCIKCSGSNWTRAAMMDEKKTVITSAKLSVRGDEETFVGSTIKDANLNLLVPETS